MNESSLTQNIQQGSSWITDRKEFEVRGLTYMRSLMLKSPVVSRYFDRLIFADIFSGSGENRLSAEDDPIEGSPLRILSGFTDAILTKKGSRPLGLEGKRIDFFFSDIRDQAISHLSGLLKDWEKPEKTCCYLNTAVMAASSAMQMLSEELDRNPYTHLVLFVDPNGPKAFPRDELTLILEKFSHRVDLIINISATAINRCLAHRDTCGVHYPWLTGIESLDSGYINAIAQGRDGWIRKPITNDHQKWFLLPTFTPLLVPRYDWAKQGFVPIRSPEGAEAIRIYSGIRKAA